METHFINTDRRPLGHTFTSRISRFKNESMHLHRYVDPARWGIGPGLPLNLTEYGYVATDLALLKLRRRGGCDYVLVEPRARTLVSHRRQPRPRRSRRTSRDRPRRRRANRSQVTNGDNVYHVDFFRRILDEMDAPGEPVAVATDFWCHLVPKEFAANRIHAEFAIGAFDLGAGLFRASYLDAKNET